MRYAILAALTLATPVAAGEQMSPEAFEQATEGRTFHFSSNGGLYGAERYLPGRRVIWSFVDGQEVQECLDGEWYVAEDGDICFVYEDDLGPQCWAFYREGDRIRGEFQSEPTDPTVYMAEETSEPLLCMGPDVGV
ncbi:hypothetical protein AADZ90_014195 [Aestuariibius sp. 2305UL40-4]|uniref:hypothetical protein n=1 Tax=Aestuariibius violaceus TaxID=3234132 RepID=UPI00345E7B9F